MDETTLSAAERASKPLYTPMENELRTLTLGEERISYMWMPLWHRIEGERLEFVDAYATAGYRRDPASPLRDIKRKRLSLKGSFFRATQLVAEYSYSGIMYEYLMYKYKLYDESPNMMSLCMSTGGAPYFGAIRHARAMLWEEFGRRDFSFVLCSSDYGSWVIGEFAGAVKAVYLGYLGDAQVALQDGYDNTRLKLELDGQIKPGVVYDDDDLAEMAEKGIRLFE
jgi:hypothetical protein